MRWTALFVGATILAAQQSAQRQSNNTDPCLGGVGTSEVDAHAYPSLDQLVRAAQLIVVGTVAKVLPAFSPNPDHPNSVETNSLVSVTKTLFDKPSLRTNTITLAQIGGKVGRCGEVVPADPLVKAGEQYVLFLIADDRKELANTSGSPRYWVLGLWYGKAKLADGKVKFLSDAGAQLHKFDDSDASAFIETVTARIALLR